jgi:hypothetical protein
MVKSSPGRQLLVYGVAERRRASNTNTPIGSLNLLNYGRAKIISGIDFYLVEMDFHLFLPSEKQRMSS